MSAASLVASSNAQDMYPQPGIMSERVRQIQSQHLKRLEASERNDMTLPSRRGLQPPLQVLYCIHLDPKQAEDWTWAQLDDFERRCQWEENLRVDFLYGVSPRNDWKQYPTLYVDAVPAQNDSKTQKEAAMSAVSSLSESTPEKCMSDGQDDSSKYIGVHLTPLPDIHGIHKVVGSSEANQWFIPPPKGNKAVKIVAPNAKPETARRPVQKDNINLELVDQTSYPHIQPTAHLRTDARSMQHSVVAPPLNRYRGANFAEAQVTANLQPQYTTPRYWNLAALPLARPDGDVGISGPRIIPSAFTSRPGSVPTAAAAHPQRLQDLRPTDGQPGVVIHPPGLSGTYGAHSPQDRQGVLHPALTQARPNSRVTIANQHVSLTPPEITYEGRRILNRTINTRNGPLKPAFCYQPGDVRADLAYRKEMAAAAEEVKAIKSRTTSHW